MVAALGVLFFLNEQPSYGSLGKVLDATVPPGVVPGRDPKGPPEASRGPHFSCLEGKRERKNLNTRSLVGAGATTPSPARGLDGFEKELPDFSGLLWEKGKKGETAFLGSFLPSPCFFIPVLVEI